MGGLRKTSSTELLVSPSPDVAPLGAWRRRPHMNHTAVNAIASGTPSPKPTPSPTLSATVSSLPDAAPVLVGNDDADVVDEIADEAVDDEPAVVDVPLGVDATLEPAVPVGI